MQADGLPKNPVLEVNFAKAAAVNTVIVGLLGEAGKDESSRARQKVWIDMLRQANGSWSLPEWNVLAVTARVMLIEHPAYSEVMRIAQEHGAP